MSSVEALALQCQQLNMKRGNQNAETKFQDALVAVAHLPCSCGGSKRPEAFCLCCFELLTVEYPDCFDSFAGGARTSLLTLLAGLLAVQGMLQSYWFEYKT